MQEDEQFNINMIAYYEKNYLINGPVSIEYYYICFSIRWVKRSDSGGHSIFLGQVRADEINGKKVKAIEYSAYEGMVKVEADKIKEINFIRIR